MTKRQRTASSVLAVAPGARVPQSIQTDTRGSNHRWPEIYIGVRSETYWSEPPVSGLTVSE